MSILCEVIAKMLLRLAIAVEYKVFTMCTRWLLTCCQAIAMIYLLVVFLRFCQAVAIRFHVVANLSNRHCYLSGCF